MHTTMRAFQAALLLVILVLAGLLAQATGTAARAPVARGELVGVHLFWSATCPHCTRARRFVEDLAKRDPHVGLRSYELDGDGRNEAAFLAVAQHFAIDPPAVPLIVVGDEVFVGYDDDATSGAEIAAKVAACRATSCRDAFAAIVANVASPRHPAEAGAVPEGLKARRPALPDRVALPLIGEIETRTLSLPALTIVLGAVDGFNPCAMWVLVFLIGLLVGMNDPVRMWSYGAVFIATSAVVYFAFMAAWLNLFLYLGSLAFVRIAVGLFALGAAAYYLREFIRNPDGACPVTTPGERQGIMERLRSLVAERSFLAAILGIVVLAVGVNMIELLCSAGIPAVYTQVLALSNLSAPGYYGYLALYIAAFMLDDAAIFVAAMMTLRATGLAATYSRYSHLVGGAVMAAIGFMLLFRPEWLAFA